MRGMLPHKCPKCGLRFHFKVSLERHKCKEKEKPKPKPPKASKYQKDHLRVSQGRWSHFEDVEDMA